MSEIISGLPLCQIVSSANGRVIRADANFTCYVDNSNPADERQLWQAIQYPDMNAFALITRVGGLTLALSGQSGVDYPQLSLFKWDPSWLWQLGGGISTVRDSSYCLTMEGAGGDGDPWPPGTRIQMYKHQTNPYYTNQGWNIVTLPNS